MADVTRRDAIALGAAGVAMLAPLPAMEVKAAIPPKTKQLVVIATLNKEVRQYLSDIPQSEIDRRLDGVYAKVFTHAKINHAVEHLNSTALGFAIPREVIQEGLVEKELPAAVEGLIYAFREHRELRAAALFNNPYTADRGRGPLLSLAKGNAFDIPRELNADSLKLACGRIADMGAVPTALLVPEELSEEALKLAHWDMPVIGWPQLSNKQAWFVLTSASGLSWDEREPFEMDSWADNVTDNILVKAYERSGFVCTNPAAVFGSAPAAPYCAALALDRDKYSRRVASFKPEGTNTRIASLADLQLG